MYKFISMIHLESVPVSVYTLDPNAGIPYHQAPLLEPVLLVLIRDGELLAGSPLVPRPDIVGDLLVLGLLHCGLVGLVALAEELLSVING
jgi:hypothetical protein